jgi:hypothetical protein
MSTHSGTDASRLRSIARRAMLERGLLPPKGGSKRAQVDTSGKRTARA